MTSSSSVVHPEIPVVAALIRDGERFFICQRPWHKVRGGCWEFPGGKTEPGETPEEALVRECREELDVTLNVGALYFDLVHRYPDITVHLYLYECAIAAGTPQLLEHAASAWITKDSIADYEFCPADKEILERLKK